MIPGCDSSLDCFCSLRKLAIHYSIILPSPIINSPPTNSSLLYWLFLSYVLLTSYLSSIVYRTSTGIIDYQDPRSKIRSVHEESSCAYTLLFSLFSCLLFLLNTARRSDGQTVMARIPENSTTNFKSVQISFNQMGPALLDSILDTYTLPISMCHKFPSEQKVHPPSTIHNPQSTIHNPQSNAYCILGKYV